MKKTITKMFAVAGMVAATMFTSNAQISAGLSLGANLPMGDFGDSKTGFKTGFGLGVHGRYDINDNMKVGLNTGYYSFTSQASDKITFTVIPVLGVFDYYFMTDGIKPYAGLDLGMYLGQVALDGKSDGIDATNKFGIAPHAGVAYGISDAMDVFGSVGYNWIFNKDDGKGTKDLTYIGVSLGVNYKFGN